MCSSLLRQMGAYSVLYLTVVPPFPVLWASDTMDLHQPQSRAFCVSALHAPLLMLMRLLYSGLANWVIDEGMFPRSHNCHVAELGFEPRLNIWLYPSVFLLYQTNNGLSWVLLWQRPSPGIWWWAECQDDMGRWSVIPCGTPGTCCEGPFFRNLGFVRAFLRPVLVALGTMLK